MKKLALFLVSFLALELSFAQDFEGYYSAAFDFNQPLINTKWISSTSLFGIKAGYHRLLNEKFSLGGELNFGTYSQYHAKETFEYPTGALTTDYFNYVYAYGLTASGRYYLSYNHLINPFVGVGLGAAYNKYTMYYNVYNETKKAFGFLARPEAGMIIRFSQRRAVSGLVGIHYDYSTAGSKGNGYSGFSNVGLNLGIVILDW
jgi:hypothetical protein